MKNFNGSQDHRLETLEGRSLLSGVLEAGPDGATHEHVIVADTDFLNAPSDPATPETAGATYDADAYDFGGAWGTQAMGIQEHAVDLDNGAVDQEPGGPTRRITPADLSTLVPPTYGRAAEYDGGEAVITSSLDPVAADAPVVEAPEDVPAVTVPVQPPAVVSAPEAITVAATSGGSTIVWLELPGAAKKTDGSVVADSVVIVSTFITM